MLHFRDKTDDEAVQTVICNNRNSQIVAPGMESRQRKGKWGWQPPHLWGFQVGGKSQSTCAACESHARLRPYLLEVLESKHFPVTLANNVALFFSVIKTNCPLKRDE